MAETLRIWWQAQRARANYGEFAQAVLRTGIGFVLVSAYYPWVDWGPHTWVLHFIWGFVAYTLVLFAWVYRARESSDVIRFLTLAVDMGTPTILLGLTGEKGAIVLFVYTWVAVGHGFRFGLRYLYIAWTVSLVAFALVYAISAAVDGYWYEHPLVWVGAFISVGAPTFYVAQFLKQKLVAVRAAEEARVQMERAQADAERERAERARADAERARAEAEAASEAKSEFLATMSHEMRTPLNGVVGAAEMLAAKDLPHEEHRLVDWLLASSRQLRSLIDNLLDLRKIEAGKMAIERSPFDLHALMNRLAALFEPEAKRAHLRFTKGISANAPYRLLGDDVRIQQVLINLTANALKFTRQGFVRVSVSALDQTDLEVTLRFEVRDTGIGIPPENAGRIFDRGLGPRFANTWLSLWVVPSVLTVNRERGRLSGLPFCCRDSQRRRTRAMSKHQFATRVSFLFLAARQRTNGLQGQRWNNNFDMDLSPPSTTPSRQPDKTAIRSFVYRSSTETITASSGVIFQAPSGEEARHCHVC